MTMENDFKQRALGYHRGERAGKLAIHSTRRLAGPRDLALAYSPGVGYVSEAIHDDPLQADLLTGRANRVGVITNGTAVLGLGAIGPLAAKPVMEGKAVLFKKFADIDAIDLEIDELNPGRLIEIIASLEPTFGGINLEDIKAPECFEVERRLKERMRIPVFHDDQHGTAIIVASAVVNGLRVTDKTWDRVRLVCVGAGAAALACLDQLVNLGLPKEQIIVSDLYGIVHCNRKEGMDPYKATYAIDDSSLTLEQALKDADIVLGLSAPGSIRAEWLKEMAPRPLVFVLANPTPEIPPEEIQRIRPDAILATGRSDYPNQVNNVLCFPYVFRGALDVGATAINEAMKRAAVKAISDLALKPLPQLVLTTYGLEELQFGPGYLIPKPFDPRLISQIAPAVARAAMESGVARRPIDNLDGYRHHLETLVYRSGLVMRPIFAGARRKIRRVVFAEGEETTILRAVGDLVHEKLIYPILIGRPEVIDYRLRHHHVNLKPEQDFELVNPNSDSRYSAYWAQYHALRERHGITPELARFIMRTQPSAIAAMMVRRGEADAMICGSIGRFVDHLRYIEEILGTRKGISGFAALSGLILPSGPLFFADTYVKPTPSPLEIAEVTEMSAEVLKRFGIEPKIALLSFSNFGSSRLPDAERMREALELIHERAPELEVEGEMHADAALSESIREHVFPNSLLHGKANLLILPSLEAANIAMNLAKVLSDAEQVGPILLGADRPAHILTPSADERAIYNLTALAATDYPARIEQPR